MNAAEAVERAAATGRWMVAAWRIDDAGAMHLDRVWVNFPEERCGEAIELLRSDVAKAGGKTPSTFVYPAMEHMEQWRLERERAKLAVSLAAGREILDVSVVPPKPNDEGEKT